MSYIDFLQSYSYSICMAYIVLQTIIKAHGYQLYIYRFVKLSVLLTSMSYVVLLTIITTNEYELYCFVDYHNC